MATDLEALAVMVKAAMAPRTAQETAAKVAELRAWDLGDQDATVEMAVIPQVSVATSVVVGPMDIVLLTGLMVVAMRKAVVIHRTAAAPEGVIRTEVTAAGILATDRAGLLRALDLLQRGLTPRHRHLRRKVYRLLRQDQAQYLLAGLRRRREVLVPRALLRHHARLRQRRRALAQARRVRASRIVTAGGPLTGSA